MKVTARGTHFDLDNANSHKILYSKSRGLRLYHRMNLLRQCIEGTNLIFTDNSRTFQPRFGENVKKLIRFKIPVQMFVRFSAK